MTHFSDDAAQSPADSIESPCSLVLEVTRGKTAAPVRPVIRDRFLIGAGVRCDLRLGGNDMPPIHSILHVSGAEIWIDSLVDSPCLSVNGKPLSSSVLNNGDEVEIGSFRLVLHRTADANSEQPVIFAVDASGDSLDADPPQPQEMSPLELIELIEQEEELIEEFEARRRMGAEALMTAIREQTDLPTESTEPQFDVPNSGHLPRSQELLQELETAIGSLNRIAHDLEHRAEQLDEREVRRAAGSLLDFQHELVGRLDDVLAKIAAVNDAESHASRRRDVA